MRDVWAGAPDTDKAWKNDPDLVRLRAQLDAQLVRAHADNLARFFGGAELGRHNFRVYRKLGLIQY